MIKDIKKYKRVISIGDIHGCIDQLKSLISNIKPTKEDLLIFLGDYIDRGPNSPAVIDFLINLRKDIDCIFLRGNHESMFLSFINQGGSMGEFFLENGGKKTLKDYDLWDLDISNARRGQLLSLFQKIPPAHIDFIKDTELFVETENEFYSHAGFDIWNSNKYNEQRENEYTWTRERFLNFSHTPLVNKFVIHGHTPIEEHAICDLQEKKINLDSWCFFSGVLSALVLDTVNPDYQNFVQNTP